MAPQPHGDAIANAFATRASSFCKPPRVSSDALQRTVSDISFELTKEEIDFQLQSISEVEDARCECCGMSEECTGEYIDRVRERHMGKWICGLCGEAVKEELDKNGGNMEEGMRTHTNACVRFNKINRAYPVLFQAAAMREMLKKSKLEGRGVRANFISPNDKAGPKKGSIARSSSCIPAITREMNNLAIKN